MGGWGVCFWVGGGGGGGGGVGGMLTFVALVHISMLRN